MKVKYILLLILTTFLISFKNNKIGQTTVLSDNAKNHSIIDSLMVTSFKRGIFNGNILVAKNNEILYQNEFGYTDASKSKKISRNSIFNIGSIAKEFNAVAIMILLEKGLLNLDDTLSKFDLQLPKWSNTINVRHLLLYTSGLPLLNWDSVKNDQDIYADLRSIESLEFDPGSNYIYSNNNIFLQRKIVEKVSGMNFNDFIQKNILTPCNMKQSIIDPNTDNPQLVKAFSNDYINDESTNIEYTGWVHPSINDLHSWLTSLHSGLIISDKSVKQLLESYSKNSSSAIGVGEIQNNRLLFHQHHGSNYNFESFIYYNSQSDLSIILMTNNKNFKLQEIANSIENITNGKSFLLPQKSIYLTIRQKCYDDVDDGIQYYKNLKNNDLETYNFSDENELIRVGYKLIEKEQYEEGVRQISICTPNTLFL